MCANDPDDTMIAERSSLKDGVAQRIVEEAAADGALWCVERSRLPLWLHSADDPDTPHEACQTVGEAWAALRTLLSAGAVRDPQTVRQALMMVHFCDGRHNKTLGAAMQEDAAAVQRWAQNLLVWGPVSQPPAYDAVAKETLQRARAALRQRGGDSPTALATAARSVAEAAPRPLAQVHACIQAAIANGAAGPNGQQAMALLGAIIADLHFAYLSRAAGGNGSGPPVARLGVLLPLRCGHNNPLRRDERAKFCAFLTSQGWLDGEKEPGSD